MSETTVQSEKGRRELQAFAKRIVTLEEQQAQLKHALTVNKADIKEIYGEAASTGFNPKALKIAVAELQMDAESRQMKFEFEDEVDLYRHALGIAPGSETAGDDLTDSVVRDTVRVAGEAMGLVPAE